MEEFERESKWLEELEIKSELNGMFLNDLFESSKVLCDKMVLETIKFCDKERALTKKFFVSTVIFASINLGLVAYSVTKVVLEHITN